MDITLGMFFLILSNVKINFNYWKFSQKTYTIVEALPTTRQIELVGKKGFTTIAFNPENENFVVYVIYLTSSDLDAKVYLFCYTQIVLLKVNEVPTVILSEYANFKNIFFFNFATELQSTLRSIITQLI